MTQMKVTLVGAKSTDWKSDDGRHYDHVTLYALIPMDVSQGNAVGQGVAEFGGVSKSMLKQSRLNFDKIEKCE